MPPPGDRPDGARTQTTLEATAQLLTFAPGLYAVDFITPNSAATNAGLRLPCARLEPVPPAAGGTGQCFVSIMAEGGWLSQGDQPTFIHATGGPNGGNSGVMLTIYKAAGQTAAPELRIRRVQPNAQSFAAPAEPAAPQHEQAGGEQARGEQAGLAAPSDATALALLQLVHIQGLGDVQTATPLWAGRPGSGRQIEGFAILPSVDVGPDDIEYQAILGEDWNTSWTRGGAFCGSRNMGIPLLGVRIRLVGAAAERFECRYWGCFANTGVVGPRAAGEACEGHAAGGRAVMEALRVVITRRPPAALPEPAKPAGTKPPTTKTARREKR